MLSLASDPNQFGMNINQAFRRTDTTPMSNKRQAT
jgi:hypothetical protein